MYSSTVLVYYYEVLTFQVFLFKKKKTKNISPGIFLLLYI